MKNTGRVFSAVISAAMLAPALFLAGCSSGATHSGHSLGGAALSISIVMPLAIAQTGSVCKAKYDVSLTHVDSKGHATAAPVSNAVTLQATVQRASKNASASSSSANPSVVGVPACTFFAPVRSGFAPGSYRISVSSAPAHWQASCVRKLGTNPTAIDNVRFIVGTEVCAFQEGNV